MNDKGNLKYLEYYGVIYGKSLSCINNGLFRPSDTANFSSVCELLWFNFSEFWCFSYAFSRFYHQILFNHLCCFTADSCASGVPNFWLQIFKNVGMLSAMIQVRGTVSLFIYCILMSIHKFRKIWLEFWWSISRLYS